MDQNQLFAHCYFSFSGIAEPRVSQLKNIIKHGGKIVQIIDKKATHLIATPSDFMDKTDAVVYSMKKADKIKIVTEQFIEDSIKSSLRLSEDPYIITNETKKGTSIITPIHNLVTSGKWKTARVFISSTFRDMHGERDYLTRYVFPELQERSKKLRVHVNPIDLRWGVTEEETQKALELCLTEIEYSRPFFIGMIGERYGWVPDYYQVPETDPRFDWVQSIPPGKSVTHMEFMSAVLRNPEESKCAICFRNGDFSEKVPSEYKNDFRSENSGFAMSVEELKEEIRLKVKPDLVFDYDCSFRGVVDNKPMTGDLEAFGSFVLETMWKHFCDVFPEQSNIIPDELQISRSYHDQFVENHSRGFVGRKTLLDQITSAVDNVASRQPVVIIGEPGSGKTSLVATFVRDYTMSHVRDCVVIAHFVGAAPGSTNIRHTLTRLCQEFLRIFNITETIPEEYRELKNLFLKLLNDISSSKLKSGSRLLLVFDALNQFDNTYSPSSLDWLPEILPMNIRILVSTLKGHWLDSLRRREVVEIPVGALDLEERKEIVRQTLWEYRKKLDERPGYDQMGLLLEKKDSMKPLYLITACEELRVFGVFEDISERILKMSDSVGKLLEEVLQRFETDHGVDLVRRTLTLLESSRGGLLESEMLQLLGSSFDRPLPHITWSRLYRSMSAFLRPPGETGEGVLDFFHRQLAKAVRRRYVTNNNGHSASAGSLTAGRVVELETNRHLARFFLHRGDSLGDRSWISSDSRALSELPYHLLQGQLWKELGEVMTDLVFIERKCKAGMTYDLVNDYVAIATSTERSYISGWATAGENWSSLGSDSFPDHGEEGKYVEDSIMPITDLARNEIQRILENIAEFHQFFQESTHVLSERPSQTFPMAASYPDISVPAQHAKALWESGRESRLWFKWCNKPQLVNPCSMTITGHTMVVRCCCVSPDGKFILSASDDQTMRVWNLISGVEVMVLKGHKTSVMWCAYSKSQKYIVSGSFDRTVKLWDASNGTEIETFHGHKSQVNCVEMSPDENWIASGSQDTNLFVWDVAGKCLSRSLPMAGTVSGCSYSSDGLRLVACCGGTANTAVVYDTQTWNVLATLQHEKGVQKCRFSPDNSKIVTSSDDRTIKLWNSTSFACEHTLKAHKDGVCSINFSPDGQHLVSGSFDNFIILWNTETGEQQSEMTGHTGTVFCAVYTPDNQKIVTSSFDRSVKIWNVANAMAKVSGHTARLLGSCFFSSKLIVTAARDKTLKLWSAEKQTELATLAGHRSNVFACDVTPDGKYILSASRDFSLMLWQTSNAQHARSFTGHTAPVNTCALSPDGTFFISGSDDKTLKIWSTTGSLITSLEAHKEPVRCVAFSPDGRRFASVSEDKVVKLWDAKSYALVATMSGHEKPIRCCSFSPDGSKLLVGDEGHFVFEWNTKNARLLDKWKKHTATVAAVCYSIDGKYIFTASTDGKILMLDAKTKEELCAYTCRGRVTTLSVCKTKSDSRIVAGDGSGNWYLLALQSRQNGLVQK